MSQPPSGAFNPEQGLPTTAPRGATEQVRPETELPIAPESSGQTAPSPQASSNAWYSSLVSGRGQIVLAAVMWSTSGFFAKAPWFDAWPEETRGLLLAFWRSFFASIILIPLIRCPRWQWQMLPMVVCFATMVWSFMTAMVHGPAANAIWLQYLSPAWVLLASVVLLKEKVSPSDLRMFAFCLAGVLLILVMEMRSGVSLYATYMGILSGVTFAGVVICIRSMREADPAFLITLNHGATALLLSPWVFSETQSISPWSYVVLGLFGIIQMSIPYVLFARGLKSTTSPEASVLTLIEPILVPLWVFIAWRNHPSYDAPHWWTLAGGGLILVGLVSRYARQFFRLRTGSNRSSTS